MIFIHVLMVAVRTASIRNRKNNNKKQQQISTDTRFVSGEQNVKEKNSGFILLSLLVFCAFIVQFLQNECRLASLSVMCGLLHYSYCLFGDWSSLWRLNPNPCFCSWYVSATKATTCNMNHFANCFLLKDPYPYLMPYLKIDTISFCTAILN